MSSDHTNVSASCALRSSHFAHTCSPRSRARPLNIASKSYSVLRRPVARTAIVAAIIFVVAHIVLLLGITVPDKLYFDEVHYVPAARQML